MVVNNTRLSDLCIGSGSYGIAASAVPYSNNLPTYLRITDINDDGTINFDGLKSVADTNAAKYYLAPNDIVFARTGASTGRNYFYDGTDGNFVYAGFLIKFSVDPEKVNPLYVKYYCQSKAYYDWVTSFNTGSTRGNINAQTLGSMPIPLLPRTQQDIIANTFSALDARIAGNKKINHHLEQMAQAIFNDFQLCCKGSTCLISEIAELNTNTYSLNENWSEVNYLDTGNITAGVIDTTQRLDLLKDKLPSRARRKVQSNDIVYSTVRPNQRHFGIIANPSENMLVSTGFTVIRSVHPAICNEYIYLALSSETIIESLQQLAEQSVSTYPSIKPSDIGNCEILVPSIEDGNKLKAQLEPLFQAIASNREESTRLATIRDTLLPKLMSGELSVADLAAK